MQVVKGFSEFTFQFLSPNLPKPMKRKTLEVHWPRWYSGGWTCHYAVEGMTVALFRLTRNGLAIMVLTAADGMPAALMAERLSATTPYEQFDKFPDVFGASLVKHLREVTKKSR